MRDNVAEALFSLFTSLDHAEAIAGDLVEERETRGSVWFWLNVARTMLALWRRAVMQAPVRTIGLALWGCVLFIGPAFVGAAAVGLFPQLMGSFVSWMVLTFCWGGGALWVGSSLIGFDPRHAMVACATLAVTSELVLIGLRTLAPGDAFSNGFYTTGLIAPAALLAGAALARRRTVANAMTSLEQGT